MKDLEDRVVQFMCLELPGQPQMMHMGTRYLVQDLLDEIKKQTQARDQLLVVALNALEYHRQQTRPIDFTDAVILRLQQHQQEVNNGN
jgi:hemerythrin-like domain-containing protein